MGTRAAAAATATRTAAATATGTFERRNTNEMVQQDGAGAVQAERDGTEFPFPQPVRVLRAGHGSAYAGTVVAQKKHGPIGPLRAQAVREPVAGIREACIPAEERLEYETRPHDGLRGFHGNRKRR